MAEKTKKLWPMDVLTLLDAADRKMRERMVQVNMGFQERSDMDEARKELEGVKSRLLRYQGR